MLQTGLIPNAHNDLVTDASYDFYGLRLATCSLDQRIKIWQLDEENGTWNVEDDWKAHDAAISKVSWAHPEFGSVLASASFDRTVKVWEQTATADVDLSQMNGTVGPSNSRWVERAMLVDAKGTVRAVEFAPQQFGLKLATISSDNHLRVYECLEQPSLSTWQLSEEVDVLSLPSTSPANRSNPQTVTLATPTQLSAPLDSTSASLVTHALQQQQQLSQAPTRPGLGNREADGGWCISWCKDKYWGEIIAAGCGINGTVKIIHLAPSHRPTTLLTLDPSPTPYNTSSEGTTKAVPASPSDNETPKSFAITSVAWAPSCGRSYHLVATGGRDGHVRIWRVKPPTPDDDQDGGDGEADITEGRWSASIVGDFDDHKFAVGRVEWNITGTILSSSGNDGRIRLWKMTAGNVWRPAGHISVEQAEEQADVEMPPAED
ncbi:Nucleoporin seh1 [Grifola frondosa]|uniref:Nucleoporin seh1 n=1 Tax=Grifola frondosa TaxID=5627 RepID=A0A1C7MN60_GRIFR|nr:Nucleoporin seh1 [Grifola frondosa]